MIPWLEVDTPFPPVESALREGAEGLLAAGADLSPARLLNAYRHGIFPWYSIGQPILWWSTDPRMVLRVEEFKVSHSLRKLLKKIQREGDASPWQIRFDTAFESVIRACAAPRQGETGTWINHDIVAAYTHLHQLGYAHSVETWLNGELVGGAYGVALGRMFFGESMFARVSNASKIAICHLTFFLREQGVEMLDCQQETAHLASFGARAMPRSEFLHKLDTAIQQAPILNWHPLDDLRL